MDFRILAYILLGSIMLMGGIYLSTVMVAPGAILAIVGGFVTALPSIFIAKEKDPPSESKG